jgi:hypothetical protein
MIVCAGLAGCASARSGSSNSATTPVTSAPRAAAKKTTTTVTRTSTAAALTRGCQPANGPGYVAQVFCWPGKAGIANQIINSDCGHLLAHDLEDPGHACLNEIESYQTLLTRLTYT